MAVFSLCCNPSSYVFLSTCDCTYLCSIVRQLDHLARQRVLHCLYPQSLIFPPHNSYELISLSLCPDSLHYVDSAISLKGSIRRSQPDARNCSVASSSGICKSKNARAASQFPVRRAAWTRSRDSNMKPKSFGYAGSSYQ